MRRVRTRLVGEYHVAPWCDSAQERRWRDVTTEDPDGDEPTARSSDRRREHPQFVIEQFFAPCGRVGAHGGVRYELRPSQQGAPWPEIGPYPVLQIDHDDGVELATEQARWGTHQHRLARRPAGQRVIGQTRAKLAGYEGGSRRLWRPLDEPLRRIK